jgi:hypothetical protein
MNLEYVPQLQIQLGLQSLPRDMTRFRQYRRVMLNEDGGGMKLPTLALMNPMGKDHVTALLNGLLAIDADGIAALAVAEASAQMAADPEDFKVGLVIADDLMGGWTNRYATEYTLRFPRYDPARPRPRWLKHNWISGVLWSSEAASARAVREAILTGVYRTAYIRRHGCARTLRDKLVQEGQVMARAGCSEPFLDGDDVAYTREVLVPFLDADDMRTTIECLFGDAAGLTLGFTPRGLSPWAGLALGLHDELARTTVLRERNIDN